MIDLIFYKGTELLLMRVLQGRVYFLTPHLPRLPNNQMYPISLLEHVSKGKLEVISKKISTAETEDAIADIVVKDMEEDGFKIQARRRF